MNIIEYMEKRKKEAELEFQNFLASKKANDDGNELSRMNLDIKSLAKADLPEFKHKKELEK